MLRIEYCQLVGTKTLISFLSWMETSGKETEGFRQDV